MIPPRTGGHKPYAHLNQKRPSGRQSAPFGHSDARICPPSGTADAVSRNTESGNSNTRSDLTPRYRATSKDHVGHERQATSTAGQPTQESNLPLTAQGPRRSAYSPTAAKAPSVQAANGEERKRIADSIRPHKDVTASTNHQIGIPQQTKRDGQRQASGRIRYPSCVSTSAAGEPSIWQFYRRRKYRATGEESGVCRKVSAICSSVSAKPDREDCHFRTWELDRPLRSQQHLERNCPGCRRRKR